NGPIAVEIFSHPEQIIGLQLLPNVTYRRTTLDRTAIDPVNGTIVAVDAVPQAARVGEQFPDPLRVLVTDTNGDPVARTTVTFSAPADGASATLSDTVVTTDENGIASIGATANTIVGSYLVMATVENVETPATFSLTNTAGAAAATVGASGTLQSAV